MLLMCVCMHTHQEDQVGLLVKGSGDADPLFLPTRQDDPLSETAMNALGATSLRRCPLTRSQHAAHERPRSSSPPGAGERDQALFPALLVHEEMRHDSGRSEQGPPRLITHKTSHPHSAVMDLR